MTLTRIRPEAPARPTAGRRVGYLVSVAINLVLIWLIDVSPGWQSVSWVTPAAAEVVGWVTASLAVSAAVNVVYLVRDSALVRAAGDALTNAVSLIASVAVWRVFPFDLSGSWLVLAQVLVVVATLGCAVALVVNLVRTVRILIGGAGIIRPPE